MKTLESERDMVTRMTLIKIGKNLYGIEHFDIWSTEGRDQHGRKQARSVCFRAFHKDYFEITTKNVI